MATPNLGKSVIARYGNWFRGDDDFFTHVLILENGECWRLGQGLEVVKAHRFKAPARKIEPAEGAAEQYSGCVAGFELLWIQFYY